MDFYMTKLLEQAIAQVLELPEETQNLAADALLMVVDYVNDDAHYHLTNEQIAGVQHAMGQADRGEFATDAEVKEIFGRPL
jgi:predicted transcriptional regulator